MENKDDNIALVCEECGCVSFHVLKSGNIECCSCGNVRGVPLPCIIEENHGNFQAYEWIHWMDDK